MYICFLKDQPKYHILDKCRCLYTSHPTKYYHALSHYVCLRHHRSIQGNRGQSDFHRSTHYLPLIPAQYEFLRQISEDQKNLVVGLVRDKATTEKKIAAELGDRSNIHILHADLTKYASLKQAAADTVETIGERGVDYLVANGAFVSTLDGYGPIGAL